MRSPPYSSSSSSSLASTSLTNRLETIFKKAYELTTLCDIEACVIHYGPDGELKTWPEDREKVRDLALRYSRLDEAKRSKKSVNLCGFLMKNKNVKTHLKKKAKMNELRYPISDHYSPDQISELIQSLEQSYSTLKERRRFLEAQKQKKEIKLEDHQSQSLNPSRFSLFMYNEGDATLSQIPLSALNFNQLPTQFTNGGYSAPAAQDSGLKNHLMHQELHACMSDNNNSNNFQHLCVSNTQDLSALPSELQESVNSFGLNQLMQQEEPYGFDQRMCTSDVTNSNNFQLSCVSNSNTQDLSALPSELQEPVNNFGLNQLMQQEELYGFEQSMCKSDTTNNNALDEFCSEFQVGNTSFLQEFPDMYTGYDVQSSESSLLQRSTLPSLYTVPNSYFLSDNSHFL
ncbi:unnamed protein product [Microthlaspi erraticum]|uniref:MADS-box domain-containing protein n=1 Tax=Microthlaspi erraticum TaxID=1685480 RepID=A0A6D2L6Y8_9BRAS|nr:unnamed protein product [Microthlaspi erraticum]